MKKLLCRELISCILCSLFGYTEIKAQDTIILVNGKHLPAKILEITDKKVKYKNHKDTLGPTYVVSRRDVERFIRREGCFDIEDQGYKNCVKDPNYNVIKNENFTRHIVSIELSKFFFERVSGGFDFISRKRSWGIGIYMEHSINDYDDSGMYTETKLINGRYKQVGKNKISGGLYRLNAGYAELKLYPYPHKKMVYWLAFGLSSGDYGNRVPDQIHSGSNSSYVSGANQNTNFYANTGRYLYYREFFAGLYLNNGFIWRPAKHFAIQGNFSAGSNVVQVHGSEGSHFTPILAFNAGLKIGFAF